MICNYCGQTVSSALCIEDGKYICTRCEFLLTGKKMNAIADYDYTTHDGITIWIKDLKVTQMWVQHKYYQNAIHDSIFKDKTPVEAINYIRTFQGNLCTFCGEHMTEIKHKHFAGIYCDKCWEEHKARNSGTCSICHKHYYECTC